MSGVIEASYIRPSVKLTLRQAGCFCVSLSLLCPMSEFCRRSKARMPQTIAWASVRFLRLAAATSVKPIPTRDIDAGSATT